MNITLCLKSASVGIIIGAFYGGRLDRYMLNRRLPELETAGLVDRGPARPSSITGRNAATWRVKA